MAGEWKTIDQRELKAAGARKKQRRAGAVAGIGASVAGGAYAAGGDARGAQAITRGAKYGAHLARQSVKINRAMGGTKKDQAKAAYYGSKMGLRQVGHAARANPKSAIMLGGIGLAGAGAAGWGHQRGVESYHQHKINQRRRARVKKSLKVPWEITVVEKGTLGQASRMAGMGKKSGQYVPKQHAPKKGSPLPQRKPKVKVSWATKEPRELGPALSMKENGFDTLSQSAGSKSLIPTRTLSGDGTTPKKTNWKLPASVGVAGGMAAGVGASVAQHKTAPKKKVSKGLVQTLGKPMKKPGGALKPVQPPKPAAGPKPVTPAAGPKPVAAPTGPPPTLRPPSMMPPKPAKPGQQPVRPR